MQQVKALLVGVSEYEVAEPLGFCKNDVQLLCNALQKGLNIDSESIYKCGENGRVNIADFEKGVEIIASNINKDDIFIFYFSGHGSDDERHSLLLSNGEISTQKTIEELSKIECKHKIILLDACYSGNFKVNPIEDIDLEESLHMFIDHGYAVFASSSAIEKSYSSDSEFSVFTSFLCEAILNKFIIRNGRKSLEDIYRVLLKYLEVWNIRNEDLQQHPIFKTSMIGTIWFVVNDYQPYIPEKVIYEDENCIIHDVKPIHTGTAKRYSVACILKEICTIDELSIITEIVTSFLKDVEVFENEISERGHRGKPANLISIYYGLDLFDMEHNNYMYYSTWVDDTMDKNHWYKIYGKNDFIKKDIHYRINPNYGFIKGIIEENTVDGKEIFKKTDLLIRRMIILAEKYISAYNEFVQEEIPEEELFKKLEPYIKEIDGLYFESTEFPVATIEYKKWSDKAETLIASIHNLIYAYKKDTIYDTVEKREGYINVYIKLYQKDLETFKQESQLILQKDL